MNKSITYKFCKSCSKNLPIKEFNFIKSSARYFTYCRACSKKKSKEYRTNNPECIKKYREENKDWIYKQTAEWISNHPEKMKEYQSNHYNNHKPEYKQRAKVWRNLNPEKYNKSSKPWREKHKGKLVEYQNKRRSLYLGAEGTFTEEEWEFILNKYQYRCLCCGRTDRPLTQDHIVPLSLGGKNSADNIQPLCRNCNSKKHTKIIDYRP